MRLRVSQRTHEASRRLVPGLRIVPPKGKSLGM